MWNMTFAKSLRMFWPARKESAAAGSLREGAVKKNWNDPPATPRPDPPKAQQARAGMTADNIMRECHFGICDDYPNGRAYAHGAADALLSAGLLSKNEHRLWGLALERCPGHRGGGRVWCAYCGDLPRQDES